MFSPGLVVAVVVGIAALGANAQECPGNTQRGGSKVNLPCMDRYFYKGRWIRGCTTQDDPDGRPWCSTKVDRKNVHVGGEGNWGYCIDSCLLVDEILNVVNLEDDANGNLFEEDLSIRGSGASGASANKITCSRRDCVKFQDCPIVSASLKAIARKRTPRMTIKQIKNRICSSRDRKVCCDEDIGTEVRKDVTRRPRPRPTPRRTTKRTTTRRTTTRAPALSGPVEATTYPNYATAEAWADVPQEQRSGRWLPTGYDCGEKISTGYIVGGREADLGVYPFIALLGYFHPRRNRIEYKCGGTLINRRYVVTAAHCHSEGKRDKRIVEVIIGEYNIENDPDCHRRTGKCFASPQKFKISSEDITPHPDWDVAKVTSAGNDILLIRLPHLVRLEGDFDEYASTNNSFAVKPACLPWNGVRDLPIPKWTDDPRPGQDRGNMWVAGWGKTSQKRRDKGEFFTNIAVFTGQLKELNVPIVPNNECRNDHNLKANRRQLCAGGIKGEDSCNGDSGGPLITRDRRENAWLTGIVSYGTSTCGVGKPGVYTRVTSYIDWIKDNMKP